MKKKIRVAFTVEVDVKEWAAEYGINTSEVRRDVLNYVEEQVGYSFAFHGANVARILGPVE